MPRSRSAKRSQDAEVLLVYKKSKLALYVHDKGNKRVTALLEERAPIVKDLQPSHDAHVQTLEHVKRTLSARNVSFKTCYRARLKREDVRGRLVVTVGGDGTTLDASHRIHEAAVLGVNSDPGRSVGFLCAANRDNFAELLDHALSGEWKPTRVRRLEGTLDGRPLPFPVLNDVLVAHRNPAATVRYAIATRGREEVQKSSGVWIAAPAGSTAAIASAGGRVQPIEDPRYQLRVREPYVVDDIRHELLDLTLDSEERVVLTSRMPQGVVYLDGPHVRMPWPLGAALEISLHGPPLSLYVTEEMRARRARLEERRRG
jgi:NAD+ kinase